MSTSELTAYADRVEHSIPDEALLGKLLWYSVSELRVKHDDVVKHLIDSGIATNLPLPPKDVDVFRRVCTAAERKKVPTADPEIFANYRMAEFTDDESVVRRIVRQKVDNKGKKLGHREVADIRFERKTSHVDVRTLGIGRDETALQVAAEVQREFGQWRGCLNAYAIREWIRHYILRLGATPVRPGGGVYFVKKEHAQAIDQIEDFAHRLGDYVELHSLPLIDDQKQRNMVKRAFETETNDEVDKLIDEIQDLRKKGEKLPESKYSGFAERLVELSDRHKEYQGILQSNLDESRARIDILQKQVLTLSEIVKW